MATADLFRVDGLVAVVTGGGTGIGLMIAKALSNGGASKVYILGRRKEKLDSVAAECKGLVPVQCDITSKASLQFAVDYISQDTGHINLLVANSGIIGPMATILPGKSAKEVRKSMFDDVSMEDFTNTLHVNTTANYFSILAFLELLDAGNKAAIKGGFGLPLKEGSSVPSIQSQVIVTSSVGAFLRDFLVPPAYAGSKAALIHLVKQSSTVLAGLSIRVNALAPGWFPSEMADDLIEGRDPGTEGTDDDRFIPARRFGGQEEMGGTVLYLASRAGSFCNGLILLNDGGRVAVTNADY
ncbi:short chain dehydrogenase/reductase family protein [Cucurbitaria berberidis CBS 394.84]|uniref:Short chain dehydrogenase/reductase family protein n=1 Tax=Cucurbitaria berberidis CBS 394.84 TaxID=1168544 RepID=A0A9P4LD54_9PLEO|nr:short chain dehydrogenase/reductase family protein [Cucurbitaria berberidis CBS 394.84]KAF1851481.1 short chain dehydrogenase/reductase family protein [Cucurbitaria berberidis CBS 394.84]